MLEHESISNPTHSKKTGLPRKQFYRARAHSNPLSDSHFPVPISPSQVDYALHYPKFDDPHFKEKNHRHRVISLHLLDEYTYVLRVGGIIYTITDVEELGVWIKSCLESHPLFEALSGDELENDPVVKLLSIATEEGLKVERNGGQMFQAVYRHIASCLLQ